VNWVDLWFSAVGVALAVPLVPQLRRAADPPPLSVSLPYGALVLSLAVPYYALGAWFSIFVVALSGALWCALAWRRFSMQGGLE